MFVNVRLGFVLPLGVGGEVEEDRFVVVRRLGLEVVDVELTIGRCSVSVCVGGAILSFFGRMVHKHVIFGGRIHGASWRQPMIVLC